MAESEVGETIIKNKSLRYIIPLIDEYIEINKQFLLNSYLFDVNYPELNTNKEITGIFCMFRWVNNEILKKYEYKLIENVHVKSHYDMDKEKFMVFIKLPEGIKKTVNFIVNGMYSKIDDCDKKTILRYWQIQGSAHKVYGILYKTDKYRKELEDMLNVKIDMNAELGSPFDLHQETYNKLIKKTEMSV